MVFLEVMLRCDPGLEAILKGADSGELVVVVELLAFSVLFLSSF